MGRRRLDRLPGKHPIFKQSQATATPDLPPYALMRRFAAILAGLVLVALVVVGLNQAGGGSDPASARHRFDLAKAQRELAGAPAPLAALHAQSAELLGGGRSAFRHRLAALKGYPVVVNKWASWCSPCRTEFPIFQSLAVSKGKRVAFVGVNASDSSDPAHRFLHAMPLPFPSYVDPKEAIAKSIQAPANYPITVFFDAHGRRVYIHQGGYRSKADLAADLRRYLKQ
jgi:cytochrome c biogenesis protein CcmG, thiol:disulfide interchange protein DsbE